MKPSALATWWAPRPLREKLMLGAGALFALLALADVLLTAPLEKKIRRVAAESQVLTQKIEKARHGAQGDAGQAQALREQEAIWRQRLQAAQAEAQTLRGRTAEAARLPETLRAITATVGSARLLALDLSGDSDGAVAAPATAASAAVAAAATEAVPGLPRLYRLPITLKVSGSYDELHTLLKQFERHAEALQWTSLSLDNAEWPAIQMTLKAHVLSHTPRWGAAS